jgi:glycosyltransferase involved in cell wall biosynthesis
MDVTVVTTDDDGPSCRMSVPLERPLCINGVTRLYFKKQTEFYNVSMPLWSWLGRHVTDYDLVHIHAVFSFVSVSAAWWSRRRDVPYIVCPHGVMNRHGMTQRRPLLKLLSFRLIEKPLLRNGAIHFTSNRERAETEPITTRRGSHVVPLGIDLAPFLNLPSSERFLARWPAAAGREIVLFLSRINPVKGLDQLLEAFGHLHRTRPAALLIIAGNGDPNYAKTLEAQATSLGVANAVLWVGFLDGVDKLSAFAAAHAFVLPSRSESFGLALIEAMAAGVPCVTTHGVAVSEDISAHEAGLVVTGEARPLAEALDRLLRDAMLGHRLAANARALAVKRFSLEAMGTRLQKFYEELR